MFSGKTQGEYNFLVFTPKDSCWLCHFLDPHRWAGWAGLENVIGRSTAWSWKGEDEWVKTLDDVVNGFIQAKGATVAPSYNKRHRDAPRVCTMEEKALWLQNDESEWMMQEDIPNLRNLKACDTCIPGSQAGFCQVGAERIRNALVGPKCINMHQHAIPLKYRKCNVNSVMWMVWLIYFGRIFWCLHGGRRFGLFRKPAPWGHALQRLAKCLPACMSDTQVILTLTLATTLWSWNLCHKKGMIWLTDSSDLCAEDFAVQKCECCARLFRIATCALAGTSRWWQSSTWIEETLQSLWEWAEVFLPMALQAFETLDHVHVSEIARYRNSLQDVIWYICKVSSETLWSTKLLCGIFIANFVYAKSV